MRVRWRFGFILLGASSLAAQNPEPAAPEKPAYQYRYGDLTIPRPTPSEPTIPFSPRLAVDYIEQGALAWNQEYGCVSCHSNGAYMVVRPMLTPQLGAPQEELRAFFVSELQQTAPTAADKDATRVIYMAAGLAIWDAHVRHRLSPETASALQLMFQLQHTDGSWFVDDDNNPPLESSPYQLATVAARAVANAPGWLAEQKGTPTARKVELLKTYLRKEGKMQGDYDLTDLLWSASEWKGLLPAERKRELIARVQSLQKSGGGWSIRNFAKPEEWGKGNRAEKLVHELEYGDPPSDGHMTGLAIIALREAGVAADDPHIQAGVQWLLANQRSSGRWWTRSLNRDGHQFISYTGTAYPLLALALCGAMPQVPASAEVRHAGQ